MKLLSKLKRSKAISQEEMTDYLQAVEGLEADYLGEILKSRIRSWYFSFIFAGLAFLSVGALLFVIYRYAQPIPEHMIFVNKDTGVVQNVELSPTHPKYSEIVNKYWIGDYVRRHESYDFYTTQADYDAIDLMSSSDVAKEYQKKFGGKSGIDIRLGSTTTITVNIISVLLNPNQPVATVRYEKVIHNRQTSEETKKIFVSEVGYHFRNITMTAQARYINPLGFEVTGFHTEEESSGGDR